MLTDTIDGWVAGLKVLEEWGIRNAYGLPAGSLNSLMDAFEKEQGNINFVQVRHEEVGALAAAMSAKFTGKIGVCIGSAGPGATHLFNGLYDAKYDNVPLLAIVGQRPLKQLNLDMFQEFNQNPYFVDVSVYNRRVAYPEQLPKVLDEAIRTAYAKKGVAVVEVPVDFGWAKIDKKDTYSAANAYRERPLLDPDEKDIKAAVSILEEAEKPVIYAGVGTRGCGEAVVELSKKIKAPIVITGINFDNFDYDTDALLGSAYRVGWKPANEVLEEADTILFIGSNFPFSEAENMFGNIKKFVQIDIDPFKLGKRHHADVSILGDASLAIDKILSEVSVKTDNGWYEANIANNKNWKEYMQALEERNEGELQLFQVYNAINKVAAEDAIYSIDVGNTTQTSIRHLHMNPKNMWRTSQLFATMGNGLPGAIAAKAELPERQVWSLSGDGGFTMVFQDIVTAVKYKLPSINVVFTNERFAFIRDEQEDTNDHFYGVDIADIDFAKIAEAQGAKGYTVRKIDELDKVFAQAIEDEKNGHVVVIDAKISLDRPIPVEHLQLDDRKFTSEQIKAFKERYYGENLLPLHHFLKEQKL
ncbi:MAG TPA: pyruvate oxidase [Bavariicoccus seileri]|uniref:Pyruvate oxidase n=1 Tax=Bavariicoccus seileri TaxID=549685 RepID=A0A3D4S346_9ENTE|nr:pyruvate oxidase [Bavariicoccus seileri]HCS93254.1 pyruvate oxidase [Bavariicoccus seileri]